VWPGRLTATRSQGFGLHMYAHTHPTCLGFPTCLGLYRVVRLVRSLCAYALPGTLHSKCCNRWAMMRDFVPTLPRDGSSRTISLISGSMASSRAALSTSLGRPQKFQFRERGGALFLLVWHIRDDRHKRAPPRSTTRLYSISEMDHASMWRSTPSRTTRWFWKGNTGVAWQASCGPCSRKPPGR